MSWKPWKSAEKEVSKYFGGTRRIRVSFSEEVGDILHPTLSLEVKYGKQIPACLRVKKPTLMRVNGVLYSLVPSKSKDKVYRNLKGVKKCKFLESAFKQALGYAPDKIPMVCVKWPRCHGFVKIGRWSDV